MLLWSSLNNNIPENGKKATKYDTNNNKLWSGYWKNGKEYSGEGLIKLDKDKYGLFLENEKEELLLNENAFVFDILYLKEITELKHPERRLSTKNLNNISEESKDSPKSTRSSLTIDTLSKTSESTLDIASEESIQDDKETKLERPKNVPLTEEGKLELIEFLDIFDEP